MTNGSTLASDDGSDSSESSAGELAPSVPTLPFDDSVQSAIDQVPYIGERWNRWYDYPFKVLWFLRTGWRREVIPESWRNVFRRWSLTLQQFNEHDRHKIGYLSISSRDYDVPDGEHVTVPGIWVVEFFAPSSFGNLERAIKKNGLNRDQWYLGLSESNTEQINRIRSESGWRWWRLGAFHGKNSHASMPGDVRLKLPEEFSHIELKAIQIGSGLTAVVAHIKLSDQGAAQLDTAWHQPHEPKLIRQDRKLQALDRREMGFHQTQQARERLHRLARAWMKHYFKGFFAESGSPQTLIDMLLLDQYNPANADTDQNQTLSDTFQALGVTGFDLLSFSSHQIPNMRLVQTEQQFARGISTNRTWTIWGQRKAITDNDTDFSFYGENPYFAIANKYDGEIESILVTLAISDLLRTIASRYAQIRDHARSQHWRFKTTTVNQLRDQLLGLSIDIATVKRDLKQDWKLRNKYEYEAEFYFQYSAEHAKFLQLKEPIHLNSRLRKRQKQKLKQLSANDHDYRDILSTVASLGASVEATKTGRRALIVALASLAVAVGTVMVAQIGEDSLIHQIAEFFK